MKAAPTLHSDAESNTATSNPGQPTDPAEERLVRSGAVSIARSVSIVLFVVGVFAFAGAESYKDFFVEIQSRSGGNLIDYQSLAEFCGWTGGPKPGESRLAWGLRSVWNMLSAMLAMTAVALAAFALVFGILFGVFYWSGAFD